MPTTLLVAALLAPAQPPKVAVPAEPLAIPAGAPLSFRTPVRRPAPVRDVLSWAVETRRGRGQVYASAISPDGKRFATGGADGVVRVWLTPSGDLDRALVGHDGPVQGLAWSPDGQTIASAGSGDGTARLWDVASGRPLRVLRGHKGYTQFVAWTPDGKSLAVAGGDSGFVTLWDVDKPREVRTVETGNFVYGIAWAPDGATLAVAGRQTAVTTWALREGTVVHVHELPDKTGFAVCWSPDGKRLFGTGKDFTVVWDAADHKVLTKLPAWGPLLAFSPDGSTLALSTTHEVVFYPAALDGPQRSVPAVVRSILWAPDNAHVLGHTATGVESWPVAGPRSDRAFTVAATSGVLWSPGRPVVSELGSPSPKLWDASTGKAVATLEGHTAGATVAAWSRDGKYLATGGADKTVRVWDAAGKPVRTWTDHTKDVTALAWAADGKTFASGSADGTAVVRAVGSDATKAFRKHADAVTAVAWGREGKTLATGGADHLVCVWGADADKPTATITAPAAVASLSWGLPTRGLLAGLTNGDAIVYAPTTGKPTGVYDRLVTPADVSAVAWLPDGASFVAGRTGELFQVWKAGVTKSPVLDVGTFSPVTAVGLTAGGSTLVTSGPDRAARSWDLPSGQPRATAVVDDRGLAVIAATGHVRAADEAMGELVYVVQTAKGQDTLTAKAFADRYGWKNNPAAVVPLGK